MKKLILAVATVSLLTALLPAGIGLAQGSIDPIRSVAMLRLGLASPLFSVIPRISFVNAQGTSNGVNLGVESAGLLPTNPFYFLKEFGRGVRRVFTFGEINKAGLELDIVHEKAAELQKLDEIDPENMEALKRASENYKKGVERLTDRFNNLQEASENPNVDELTDRLFVRSLKHHELFDSLRARFTTDEEFQTNLENVKDKIADAVAVVPQKIDRTGRIKVRFPTLVDESDDQLRELKAVELIDRVEEKVTGEAKEIVSALKEDLLLKFSGRLDGSSHAEAFIFDVEALSADRLRYLKFLDEIREKVLNPDLKNELNVARQRVLEKATAGAAIGEEEASRAITAAKKIISEVERLISEREGAVRSTVREMLARAKFSLGQAERFFEDLSYGPAFGQATAAQAAAKNAWNQLTPDDSDHSQSLEGLKKHFDSLIFKAREAGLNKEKHPQLFELISEAERRIVEVATLIREGTAPEVITSAMRKIKLLLATIEQTIVEILNPPVFQPSPLETKPVDSLPATHTDAEISTEIQTLDIKSALPIKVNPVNKTTPTNFVTPTNSDTTKVTATTSDNSVPVTIVMTAEGFLPQIIDIKVGTRVNFFNRDTRSHWPASNNHPTHTILSAFDSREGIAPGETYSFTFKQVGKWGYHDHLNPRLTGLIRVVE